MACTISQPMSQPHSLLSLPRELRDMVYTNVFSFDHTSSKTASRQCQLHCNTECPIILDLSPISFSWLDLMHTNGVIADEMRQLYHISSLHDTAANQTWAAQLTLNNDEYHLTWTNLPCPSDCVRHLTIDFKINFTLSKFGHWDNDSKDKPSKIFQGLLALLNQITQHGPNITVPDTLKQPIIFETLSLNISFADEEKPYFISSGPESIYILGYGKRRVYNRLIEDIVTACGNHVLEKKARNIRIQGPKSLGSPKTDISIDRNDEQQALGKEQE
ncbi:hypothetical protein E4T39_01430 [Aureobasidium subglaciale]|nr:hypothetical protein E4T39_01430 [Aureobasidium subglaciale]